MGPPLTPRDPTTHPTRFPPGSAADKAWAWIQIGRPLIIFISVFGALVGALNVRVFLGHPPLADWPAPELFDLCELMLGAALLSSGLMIHNDVTDYPSDRVNRPHKPLPRGAIGHQSAKWTGIVFMCAAVAVASIHHAPGGGLEWNPVMSALTAAIVASGIFYNDHGKMHGLLGHAIVAFGVGAIPLWGALKLYPAAGSGILPLACAIFVMEIGREIMVCIGDMPGDIEAGFRTLPIRQGRDRAMRFVLLYYAGYLLLLPIPFTGIGPLPGLFGPVYLAGAIVFAAVLLATWAATWRTIRSGNEEAIFDAFERHIRFGTRMGVVFFQLILLLEAFV
ncbi:MAG: 4-hydroxybenzoate polyprenyltransferase [Gemmatimonadetes bacterium]|nr:4-hydroxybenzoate polyprenyltransferase [Gemmatimonadota bacterium]